MIGILLVPIVLAVLLFIAASTGSFGLTLDHNVRISDSLTVMSTALLALVVQYFFAKRNSYERDLRELVSTSVKAVLTSLEDLRQWVSDAVGEKELTSSQAQKIVYGFECCIDALLMLELACKVPDPELLAREAGDLAGLVLDAKKQITGDDFPKRVITYADVERLSALRREVGQRLVPLLRPREFRLVAPSTWGKVSSTWDKVTSRLENWDDL
jgi:hypothetical protein